VLFVHGVQDTIVFGADEYDTMGDRREELVQGHVPLGIGAGSTIEHAIIDSNARIGRNVRLTNAGGVKDGRDSNLPAGVVIRDGILVVLRDAVIPDNTVV
jgi:glucose-1-phosphate adenylyltransferase